MRKYFELQLDLLEIQDKEDYLKIVELIEKNPKANFEIYHQYALLFEWYQKLLNWEISEEEFTQLWDFQSKIKCDPKKLDSISFLKNTQNFDKDTIYILDELAKGIPNDISNLYYC